MQKPVLSVTNAGNETTVLRETSTLRVLIFSLSDNDNGGQVNTIQRQWARVLKLKAPTGPFVATKNKEIFKSAMLLKFQTVMYAFLIVKQG